MMTRDEQFTQSITCALYRYFLRKFQELLEFSDDRRSLASKKAIYYPSLLPPPISISSCTKASYSALDSRTTASFQWKISPFCRLPLKPIELQYLHLKSVSQSEIDWHNWFIPTFNYNYMVWHVIKTYLAK